MEQPEILTTLNPFPGSHLGGLWSIPHFPFYDLAFAALNEFPKAQYIWGYFEKFMGAYKAD